MVVHAFAGFIGAFVAATLFWHAGVVTWALSVPITASLFALASATLLCFIRSHEPAPENRSVDAGVIWC
jgi:hypothetical protein